ncbi:MAG TPA: RHS repeat-associated core domain-containing protein, partial [Rhodanobacteraceae bacterium]|nr:RHS repeat-associated core domain-containing protein [Rhodanobacteraceae bacterium]
MRFRETINYKVLASLLVMVAYLLTGATYAQQSNTVTKVTLIMTDAQGNVLMTTDVHGNVLARYTYRPYGMQQSGPTNKGPGYTGHVNDPDTGLVYMQQRYYDPDGRFISPDPIRPTPGNIYNFNRYAYANNNPIVNIDPDGRQEVPEDFEEERRIEDELHPKLGRNWADP